ncbi:hypothetical protein MKSMC1_61210 [Mycobacterium kansasii]|nr:hypothetical protein MKSMC1_61210 [Mycobacterium kansasii]
MVTSSTRWVASTRLDIAIPAALAAVAFLVAMTAFTAPTFDSVDPLPEMIWSISSLPDFAISVSRSRK